MTQASNQKQTTWAPFRISSGHFGDQIEFLDGGTVRLGDKAFADGRRIDYSFAGNTATRDNAFGAKLTIRAADGQTFCFRYDGEAWLKLVEEFDPSSPPMYSLRQEMGHSGPVLGASFWLIDRIQSVIVYGFIYLAIPIGLIRALFGHIDDHSDAKPIEFSLKLFIGFMLLTIYLPLTLGWLRQLRQQRRAE